MPAQILTRVASVGGPSVGGLLAAVVIAGCGSSTTPSQTTPSQTTPSRTTTATSPAGRSQSTPSSGPASRGAAALSADARSAATGDIPDNQVFLTFANAAGGWAMKYPEGWTQKGSRSGVTFADKNNLVHVVITSGPAPNRASLSQALKSLQARNPSLRFTPPAAIALPADPSAAKATYTTQSAPNPVTGKRVTLTVDRYVLHRGHRVATVDLGTPRGVDNVDAYRMMIESFRWR